MLASARLAVTRDLTHSTRTRISRLRSDAPLVLRPTHPVHPEPMPRWNLPGPGAARVALVAGAAGPVGGDHLRLDVEVGPGAALILGAVAATLLLPGPHGQPSSTDITIKVAARGILIWLPGPVIAARGCDHHAITRASLEPGARLFVREELVLGRAGEQPGSVRQRLRVSLGNRALLDQELHIGPDAPGWDGPAVTGGRQVLGSLLVVDPALAGGAAGTVTSNVALMPLDGPAVLVTALASDALILRQRLDAALVGL